MLEGFEKVVAILIVIFVVLLIAAFTNTHTNSNFIKNNCQETSLVLSDKQKVYDCSGVNL